eukprot:scaffold23809_cov28-Tisochrysis_lutea.AAC.1
MHPWLGAVWLMAPSLSEGVDAQPCHRVRKLAAGHARLLGRADCSRPALCAQSWLTWSERHAGLSSTLLTIRRPSDGPTP